MAALANVALTDTFDVWRTRTNQIIMKLDQVETSDNSSFGTANAANLAAGAAFDKANTSNIVAVAAFAKANTGAVSANLDSVSSTRYVVFNDSISGIVNRANISYGMTFNPSSNILTVVSGVVIAGANILPTLAGANTAVGTGANTYLLATIAGANTAVGTGANTYLRATIAGANTAVGTGANTYLLATIAGANTAVGTGANTVGSAAFNKANSTVIPVNADVVNVTRYVPFINAVSGNVYTLNVSTSHLTFNPSSNTLTSNNINVVASLGVGTAPSGTVGEIRATSDITAYYSSDVSLKTDIFPIQNALEKVLNIRGVEFDWKDSFIEERGGADGYFVRKHDVGIIAQEIEKILPEVVATRDNGIKAVRYEKIIALLIEAIKDLNSKIEKK